MDTPEAPPNSRPQRPTLRPKPRITGTKMVLTASVQGKQLPRGGTQEAKPFGLNRVYTIYWLGVHFTPFLCFVLRIK